MPLFSSESVQSLGAQPGRSLASSIDVGWKSLYVQEWECPTDVGEFEAPETPDQTIVVFLEGTAVLEAWNGSRWDAAFRRPGSTGLTAPGERDRLRWKVPAQKSVRAAYIYLPQDLIAQAKDACGQAGQHSHALALSSLRLDDPALHGVARGLVAGIRAHAPELYAHSAAAFLAAHLANIKSASLRNAESRRVRGVAEQRTNRAVEYMRAHFAESVSLEDLASAAGVSLFYFVRMFRERVGQTPAQYLHRLRMEHAQELLVNSDLPVADVAGRCGYSNHSAFSAAVRASCGSTPTALRQRGRRAVR